MTTPAIILLTIAALTAAFPGRFRAAVARTARRFVLMAGYVLETLRPLPARTRRAEPNTKQNDKR